MFTKILKNNNALTISDDLFSEVMVRNNRRLFLSFFSILLLANLATIAIKAAGRGSEYLTYQSIAMECALAFSILIIGFYLAKRMKGHWSSSYISITGVILCLFIFQYVIYGAPEVFATFYISFSLSVLYFNRRASLYNFALIMAVQIILFAVRP